MTTIEPWLRRPTRVQALRIDTPADLDSALVWLHGHGVQAVQLDDRIVIYGAGTRMTAGVGQVIVLEPSGAFGVHEWGAFVSGPGCEFEPVGLSQGSGG